MKNLKMMALVLSVILFTAVFAGCAPQNKGGSETQPSDAPAGRTVLRVGMECAYAPFNWSQETDTLPNGEKALPITGTDYYAYGYDVMMAKKIADLLDMDLEIYKVEWASIGMGLDVGDYDAIIAGMGYTEERAALYEFTEEYFYRDICLTVNADGRFTNITKLSEFEGMAPVSITQMGTAWVDYLSEIPDVKLSTNYETTAECFMAIANNVAEVCMADYPTALSAAMTNANLKILELDPEDGITSGQNGSNRVCVACKKGNTELRDAIQGALNELEWDTEKMEAQMEEAIALQPSMASVN